MKGATHADRDDAIMPAAASGSAAV